MTAQSIDTSRRSIGSLHAVFAYLAVACFILLHRFPRMFMLQS